MRRLGLPPCMLLALLVFAAWSSSCSDSAERVDVRIDGLTVRAEVVRTPEERARGLGGRDSLPRDAGMLFVLGEEERVPSFWMRAMRFSLDFVWITADGVVAGLTEDVPPPEPGVADENLPRYGPDVPVLYALEVNAGVVREAGVAIGDTVTFEPDISVEPAP